MPNVLNEYVGDGVSKSFNIAMEGGYLSRDYVKFYVRPADALLDWVPLTDNNVTWVGEFTFTLESPVPVGTVLVVFRETPLAPLVDFQNTSRMTEANLDIGVTQPLHKVAELTDLVDRATLLASDSLDASMAAQVAAEQSSADAAASAASAAGALTLTAEAVRVAANAEAVANDALELVEEAVAGAVVSFNGRAGVVMPQTGDYTKTMVGLGDVDNTADLAKPISTATSNALGLKADSTSVTNALAANATADRDRDNHTGTQAIATVTGLQTALESKLPSSGGVLSGNLTVPSLNGGQLAGFRNKILNGRFNINQAGAASRTAAVGYNFDQWYYDGTYLYQPVPTEDVYDGTYTLSWEGDSTAAWSLNASVSTGQGSEAYTAVAKGGQIVVSGHTNEHLWVRFATDLANLNKVQLEPGDTATPYEERPKGLEEFLCQRFYESSFLDNVAPGSVTHSIFETGMYVPYMMVNGVCVRLLQRKRSLPTIAVYAPLTSPSAGKVRQADNGTILGFALDFTFQTMFVGTIIGGAQTVYQFGYTASARI